MLHVLIAGGFGLATFGLMRDVRAVPALPSHDRTRPSRPRVSVVIPARDERARIGDTVRRLLAQIDVDLEVIVVDDRSSDETGSIVRGIGREDARVRLVRVDFLPETWLGKPHACQRGAEASSSDWILFTDGDIWMSDDVIARAIAHAERERVEHVTLAPRCVQATLPARVALGAFACALTHALARANRDSRFRHVGIGAFNLVRRDAWLAIGGHQQLAYEVVDDLRLGLLLRRGGFRTRACIALKEIEAEWAGTLGRLVSALEKNMFAQLRYSVLASLTWMATVSVACFGALTGPLFGSPAGWCAFAGFASLSIPTFMMARREGEDLIAALLAPLGLTIFPIVVWHSMTTTLRRGGVAWRGTLYPLSKLRARRTR